MGDTAVSNRPKRRALGFVTVLQLLSLFMIIGLFSVLLLQSVGRAQIIEEQKAQVQAEIDRYNNQAAELQREIELKDTDAYMEKVARESLGFIKDNEIIFIFE